MGWEPKVEAGVGVEEEIVKAEETEEVAVIPEETVRVPRRRRFLLETIAEEPTSMLEALVTEEQKEKSGRRRWSDVMAKSSMEYLVSFSRGLSQNHRRRGLIFFRCGGGG